MTHYLKREVLAATFDWAQLRGVTNTGERVAPYCQLSTSAKGAFHAQRHLLAAMPNWAFSSERRNTRSNWGRFLEPIEVRLGWFPVA